LGYWLGNGSSGDGTFCADVNDVKHIVAAVEDAGFLVGPPQPSGESRGRTQTIYGLVGKLRALGVLGDKHVPVAYLRASAAQRLELIRGLMDSDGHAHKTRSEQVFTNTNFRLFEAMRDLVSSMGWNWSSWTGLRTGFGVTVTSHDLHFRPVECIPYHLPRKALRVPKTRHLSRQRIIQRVEEIPSVPTQCIAVDHPSQTYLCTDRMTVSHNTGKDYVALRYNLQFSAYSLASLQREFWVGARGEDGFGDRGEELFQRFQGAGRRGTWINLKTIKFQDAGWRGPVDYARFTLALEQMHASIKADIFPLSISGAVCQYCSFRRICGGTGLPSADHGRPE
jgi:hypothetical protein